MKRKNKLPKYWLGTAKPLSMGYLLNRGVGDTLTSTTTGLSIQPEVNAMRRSLVPNAISKFAGASLYPMLVLLNLKTIPITTTTTLAPTFTSAAAASIAPTSSLANNLASMTGGKLLSGYGMQQVGQQAGKTVTTNLGTQQILSTAGKVAGALGTAYGAYNVYNDIANADEHRSAGQMLGTRGVDTITTAEGNTYKQYGAIDAGAERAYERLLRTGKQVGLAMDSLGFGASLGGLVGGLPGMLIGGAGGLLVGGIADLLGFGNNEDEVQEAINLATAQTARLNRQARAVAEDADMKSQFANRAANGKRPVWTPAGLVGKKATARVSNGEVIGNFLNGLVTRVPGLKNNKDTKLANLKDNDFVISNKYGLSDYAAATGDYAGALNLLEILMNGMRNSKGYKCGKLPKFDTGTWLYANAILPHMFGYLKNLELLNRVESSDRTAPQTQVPDAGASRAINDMYTDRIDERDYLRLAYDLYRLQLWEGRRTPGIGLGGRMLYATNLGTQAQRQLADTRLKINELNRAQRNAARQMQLQNALNVRAHELDNFWKTAAIRQQINGAYEKYRAQIPLNLYNILGSLGSNLSQIYNTNNALDIQNRMLKLYEQGAETDRRKADAWINNLGNNNTTNSTITSTAASPASEFSSWLDSLTPAQRQAMYGKYVKNYYGTGIIS